MLLRGIRTRLLGLVLATVFPFTALIGFGLWSQWRDDQSAAIQRAITEAQLLAAQVDDHIGNVENLLSGLSRAVSTNPADESTNDAVLRQIKAELPDFISNILLFSVDGNSIGNSAETGGRLYAGDRAYFQHTLADQRLVIGGVIRGRLIGEWVMPVARPLQDNDGHVRGVLVIGTRLEHFQDALRLQGLPAGSVVRIVDQSGIVIFQSADGLSWIGHDLSGSESVMRHVATGKAREIALWPDNVQRITGSATAHRAPWLVSVGLPMDIGFAAVASRLRWGALFSTATLIVAFTIAWLLSGRLVRPLRQLGRDASVLAAGDLGHRTEIRTRDEVGVLATTFNRMAASLERRHEEAHRAAEDVRQARETLAAVIDASPVAIVCSDPNRRIALWSHAAEEIFGHTAEEAVGQFPPFVAPPEGVAESQMLFQRALDGETFRGVQLKRKRKDGSLVDVRVAAAPMFNPDGTVGGVAWAYEDVTDHKKVEDQLQRLAHSDQLTGLPNRLTLLKELGRLLAGDCRDRPTSIALFDLDGFKDVNDTLGHSTGDQLLIEVGQRFTEAADRRGKVCRLGGDEFIVIIPDCGDPRVVAEIVDSMLKRLAEPFEVSNHVVNLGACAGIAIAPSDGANVDELIANADLALYRAKAQGGCTYRFFLPVFRAQAQARRELDLELRRAFAENEFEIYFQPQIRLADNAVVGAEALLRWRHPTKGIVAPGAFIETLAHSPIAPELGRWILRTACEKTSAWRAMGFPLSRIGVNLFPPRANDDILLKETENALRETGLPAEVLELEITENIVLNYEDAAAPLQKLHEKGVRLAFDDFGTGYASLSSLTRFPVSRIKIDRSFVAKITAGAEDAAIVRSLIAMAHNLGLEVIAEGVETTAQATFLLNERCEEAQGFLYAQPLPAAEFEAYLETKRLAPQARGSVDTGLTRYTDVQQRAAGPSRRRKFPRT
jgi:diguanylate cyclase (GGDEF)-like protein/PAS domain S-box-containing protein